MKTQKLTKRQHRDGVGKGRTTRRGAGRPQAEGRELSGRRAGTADISGSLKSEKRLSRASARQNDSSGSTKAAARRTRVAPAKKLVVRQPNQKIQERVKILKERRLDISAIEPVRVQKALSASGLGSRREMEQWVLQGLVQVNGKTAQLGDKITPEDEITVRGRAVKIKWPDRLPRILLYYKQEGEIVSRSDPQGRVSVFDRLPVAADGRWVAVGRLDINTSGLLILTTSGELVNRFAHPSFEVEREYAVRVLGSLSDEQQKSLLAGVMLEDGPAKIERLHDEGGEGANHWYNVVLKEGRNREVRRLFESQGLTVSRLVRVRFGPIGLPIRLKRGQYYELNRFEVENILRWAGLSLPFDGRPVKKK